MKTDVTKIRTDAQTEERVIVPPVDIFETDNEYVIKAEMPGVSKEDVEITLDNNELTINGKVNELYKNTDNLKYAEFRLYNYTRKFTVGEEINSNALNAKLENGLLTLTLPKSEHVKPRRIEIKAE